MKYIYIYIYISYVHSQLVILTPKLSETKSAWGGGGVSRFQQTENVMELHGQPYDENAHELKCQISKMTSHNTRRIILISKCLLSFARGDSSICEVDKFDQEGKGAISY